MGCSCSCSDDFEYRPREDLHELPPVASTSVACNPDAPLGFRILRREEECKDMVRLTVELPIDEDGNFLPLSRDIGYYVMLGIPDANHPAPPVETTIESAKDKLDEQEEKEKRGEKKDDEKDKDKELDRTEQEQLLLKATTRRKNIDLENPSPERITRPYTPFTSPQADMQTGEVQFLIKVVDGGAFGAAVANLQPNDRINIRGPFARLDMTNDHIHHATKIGLLSAGSGISAILPLAHFFLNPHAHARVPGSQLDSRTWRGSPRGVLRHPAWRVVLVVFAKTLEEVPCRTQLEELAAEHPQSFAYHVVPSASPERARVGEFLSAHIPQPSSDTFVAVCGPDRFHAEMAMPAGGGWGVGGKGTVMSELGYTDGMVYSF